MPQEADRSLDLLGVKPVGEALKITTEKSLDGASAFLSRICLPAAEEFGLLLRDRVSEWRKSNATKVLAIAEEMTNRHAVKGLRANPRLVVEAIDKGSWSDDDVIHRAWAGMLASSCSEDGRDDCNVIFASLLSQLTGFQLRVLSHVTEQAIKYTTKGGLPATRSVSFTTAELCTVGGCHDVHRLDRELDHLQMLGLISGVGFFENDGSLSSDGKRADLKPTPLALHLYVRGQGFVGDPVQYWDLQPLDPEKPES